MHLSCGLKKRYLCFLFTPLWCDCFIFWSEHRVFNFSYSLTCHLEHMLWKKRSRWGIRQSMTQLSAILKRFLLESICNRNVVIPTCETWNMSETCCFLTPLSDELFPVYMVMASSQRKVPQTKPLKKPIITEKSESDMWEVRFRFLGTGRRGRFPPHGLHCALCPNLWALTGPVLPQTGRGSERNSIRVVSTPGASLSLSRRSRDEFNVC